MKDGQVITDEMAVANAHPLGAKPWGRADYIGKFNAMTEGLIAPKEAARFLDTVQDLASLPAGELYRLNVAMPAGALVEREPRHLLTGGLQWRRACWPCAGRPGPILPGNEAIEGET